MSDLRGFWKPESEATKQKRAEKRAAKKRRRKQRKLDRLLLKAGAQPQGQAHPDYRRDKKFYSSEAWRRLRYLALKNSDGRCECCGASAANGAQLHVDHIRPRHQAPWLSLDINNLQVLCGDCNIGKGAWDSTDWRSHMRSIVQE